MLDSEQATKPSATSEKVVEELHSYSRHNMQLWVQWFTFFVTVNYIALGWFAGELAEGKLHDRRPLSYVAALFIVQGALGVWVSLVWRNRLLKLGRSLDTMYDKFMGGPLLVEFSNRTYGYAIALGSIALIAMIGAWGAFALNP